MSPRAAGLLLVIAIVAVAAAIWLTSSPPVPILRQCGGWYGYNPATGKCDLGMPSGPPYPPPGATP